MKSIFTCLLFLSCIQAGFAQNKARLIPVDSMAAKKPERKFNFLVGVTYSIYDQILKVSEPMNYTPSSQLETGQCFAVFTELVYQKRVSTELGLRYYTGTQRLMNLKADSSSYQITMEAKPNYEWFLNMKYYFNKPIKNVFAGIGIAYRNRLSIFSSEKSYRSRIVDDASALNYINQTDILFIIGKEIKIKKVLFDLRLLYNHKLLAGEYPSRFTYTYYLDRRAPIYYYDNFQLGISLKL